MYLSKKPNGHGIYPLSAINTNEIRYDIIGNIALVDADLLDAGTRHPNLVVMKLSGYFKSKGCTVRLIENYSELYSENALFDLNGDESQVDYDFTKTSQYDAIYISKVFDFTKINTELLTLPNVYIGGTGFFFDHAPKLPDCIEHFRPDYHIYDEYIEHDTIHKNKEAYFKDYLNYSIGFATRGCFRQCPFCVNHKAKKVHFHSHISEWYDPTRKAIYLWDDNIFGYQHWRDVFEELAEIGKPFQFRQGMDIRLMTKEKAEILNKAKYHGDIIFAFDHIEDAGIIEEKLKVWRMYCHKATKLYVLAGYASQDEKEIESVFKRIKILIKYGCFPYIMRHELYKTSPYRSLFVTIARWCNQPQFMRNYSFREYCEANQFYHKTENTSCSAMAALNDFEEKFPDIAAEYFDMKYNEQDYVIERKKIQEAKKPQISQKKKKRQGESKLDTDYTSAILNSDNKNALKSLLFNSNDSFENANNTMSEIAANSLMNLLLDIKMADIIDFINENDELIGQITPANIPQYSNIDDVSSIIPIIKTNPNADYALIGYNFNKDTKIDAQRKYGENHYKTAALMGLVTVDRPFTVTHLGEVYNNMTDKEKRKIRAKLYLRIPIIQKLFVASLYGDAYPNRIMRNCLSEKTVARRRSNVKTMVNEICNQLDDSENIKDKFKWDK